MKLRVKKKDVRITTTNIFRTDSVGYRVTVGCQEVGQVTKLGKNRYTWAFDQVSFENVTKSVLRKQIRDYINEFICDIFEIDTDQTAEYSVITHDEFVR